MAVKNIQMQVKTDSGYDILYPEINEKKILSNFDVMIEQSDYEPKEYLWELSSRFPHILNNKGGPGEYGIHVFSDKIVAIFCSYGGEENPIGLNMYSIDNGETWNTYNGGFFSNWLQYQCNDKQNKILGLFEHYMNDNGKNGAISLNQGQTWQYVQIETDNLYNIRQLLFDGENFIADYRYRTAQRIYISNDGINWVKKTDTSSSQCDNIVSYNGKLFFLQRVLDNSLNQTVRKLCSTSDYFNTIQIYDLPYELRYDEVGFTINENGTIMMIQGIQSNSVAFPSSMQWNSNIYLSNDFMQTYNKKTLGFFSNGVNTKYSLYYKNKFYIYSENRKEIFSVDNDLNVKSEGCPPCGVNMKTFTMVNDRFVFQSQEKTLFHFVYSISNPNYTKESSGIFSNFVQDNILKIQSGYYRGSSTNDVVKILTPNMNPKFVIMYKETGQYLQGLFYYDDSLKKVTNNIRDALVIFIKDKQLLVQSGDRRIHFSNMQENFFYIGDIGYNGAFDYNSYIMNQNQSLYHWIAIG